MANLIGGIAPYRGKNNLIIGTASADFIFGDPYTTGNFLGVPEIGGPLATGRGGNDLLIGLGGGEDWLFGDAWVINGEGRGGNDLSRRRRRIRPPLRRRPQVIEAEGRGGNDWVGGGSEEDRLLGDAELMFGNARGGNDGLYGGSGDDFLYGDANDLFDNARGGNDQLVRRLGR